jgi:small subunit ribosomal protein S6
MAKPAPEYELVLMLDPEVPDDRRDQIAVEARRRIETGGDLKQERSWGLRKMAYEINQRTEADYRFFRFEKGDSVLDELNHNLKITDGVLRFRIFKVDPRAPVIDPPPPISLAATAAPRAGGRRRDDDRPPRGPEPAPAPEEGAPEAATEAAPAPEAPAEAPAPEVPAEQAPAEQPPAPEAEAAPAETPPAEDD